MPLPAAAPAIVSGLGAALGFLGQRSANATNIKLNRENRRWQERMSNTAHQRATVDLEKAGLNRILALGQPASSPSHSAAQVQNEHQQSGPLIAQAALTAAQVKNVNAQTQKTQAETIGINQMNDIKSTASSVGNDANKLYNAGKDVVEKEAPDLIQKGQDIGRSIVKGVKNLWDSTASKANNLKAQAQVSELRNKKFSDTTKRWYKLSNGKWYDLKNHKIVEIRSN